VPGAKLTTLLTTALLTSLFHTLIPDHWLPFVLIGRARGWSAATTAAVSGLSAAVHAVLSVALGVAALGVGQASARLVGETLEHAGGVLLVAFGLIYALWAWRKRGHFHPGGRLFHHDERGCGGQEGDAHPEHLHYHADEGLIAGRAGPGALLLALIVGANPCVLVLPLMMSTASEGPAATAMVTAAYVVPTVALMVGLSVGGVVSARRVRLPLAARYMELASGVLIALTGAVFMLLDA